jgi:hypothetical protein
MRAVVAFLAFAFLFFAARVALAGDCNGPPECCITDVANVKVKLPQHIRVGMRLAHVYAISEHDGTWTGEISLVTRWPENGLRPELTLRNGASEPFVAVDETTSHEGQCYRERRMRASFATWFRLRRFPFDGQLLRLLLEERAITDEQAIWEPELWPNVIAIDAYRELGGWQFEELPQLEVKRSTFAAHAKAAKPRLLIVSIPVTRLRQFYLSRYFLPLFLIVGLAYAIFFIKPDDLGSASAIGITCMLAIIAFQLTQAGTLPQVEYLTLADRVYIVCYLATAIALALAVWKANVAARGEGGLARALVLDQRMRRVFPLVFALSVGAAFGVGWTSHKEDFDADIPHIVPPAKPPPGEHP